jgi:hypothetical protein
MADNAYRLSGEYRDVTVTSVSYTASTTPTLLSAVPTNGARRTIFNNSAAARVYINKTGTTTITTTTDAIGLAAAGSDTDTLYLGKVLLQTTSATTADVRVETITYGAY